MAQIDKPNLHFNTVLYTGNGADARGITGVGFQPDFVWNKGRDDTWQHILTDSVRGATKNLYSDATTAEVTDATRLQSFDSDGFTVGTNNQINENTDTYVAWNWKAGTNGSGTTTGSGTGKTYTYSVNTAAGFSIVRWTGNGTAGHQIPHHLGVKPELILPHKLSYTSDWIVGSEYLDTSIPWQKYLKLNTTDAVADGDNYNDAVPTTSVFTVGDTGALNGNNETYVAYCFASKKGYSKIGKYTGTGSTNGRFIYTGFKPAFIFSKKINASGTQWTIWDNKRSSSGNNPRNKILHPNVTNADNTADDTDFLSNGFKLKTTASGANNLNDTFLYLAIAENPIVGSNNIPATAG